MAETGKIPSQIKVERYLFIRSESGYIVFGGKASVYLLVPAEIREQLRKHFGYDLHKLHNPRGVAVFCELVYEGGKPKLVFDFEKFLDPSTVLELKQKVEVKNNGKSG